MTIWTPKLLKSVSPNTPPCLPISTHTSFALNWQAPCRSEIMGQQRHVIKEHMEERWANEPGLVSCQHFLDRCLVTYKVCARTFRFFPVLIPHNTGTSTMLGWGRGVCFVCPAEFSSFWDFFVFTQNKRGPPLYPPPSTLLTANSKRTNTDN